ncbi:MAG TPA: formylglycine-generating enzyme family protein [Nitrospiraceae bacterium]|nr:formylglycine-generating enzyme family protein [Nitrospiraceae bacterium]
MMSSVGVIVFLLIGGSIWLWHKGYDVDQALLKIQSLVVSIHIEPEMVRVPGGTFRQGDVEGVGGSWRNPVRTVKVNAFFLGKHEVTFEEYDRFTIATGRKFPHDNMWGRGRRPVVNVSWEDARDYAEWLSEHTVQRYRLPTESEWEYAARNGEQEEIWAGTSEQAQLMAYAVYNGNSGNRTAEVGGKQSNAIKIYDLTGNVWEWVEDCIHDTYKGAPTDGSAWLQGEGGDCRKHVLRGGSWYNAPENLRTSARDLNPPRRRNLDIGFRLARDAP